MTFLPLQQFAEVVERTSLVAIDLVVITEDGRCLLGRRVNRPAQGFWFVPGGRVLKDETLDHAFGRLLQSELGLGGQRRQSAEFLGVYEHFYEDSFAGAVGVSTHYVVLAYRLVVSTGALGALPQDQHHDYCWLDVDELLSHPGVHANTRAYFEVCSMAHGKV